MNRRSWLDAAVIALALVAGCAIGWIDSRPTWDDTGVTVGAIVLGAGLLALVRPRAWWAVALAIGLPVPAFDLVLRGGLASAVALVFAFAAAAAGMLLGRVAGELTGS